MTTHPCDQGLPIRSWSCTVWWCVHHQAFWASAYTLNETGQEDGTLDFERTDSTQFGPFDTLADVHAFIRSTWDAWPVVAEHPSRSSAR